MSEQKKPINKIAELRKEKGLTLKQVGDAIGVGNNTISRYESGQREPKLETWKKLADYFDVSVPYIQGISDNKRDFTNAFDVIHSDLNKKDPLFQSSMSEFDIRDLREISEILASRWPDSSRKTILKVVDNIEKRSEASVPLFTLNDVWGIALAAIDGDDLSTEYFIKIHEILKEYRVKNEARFSNRNSSPDNQTDKG